MQLHFNQTKTLAMVYALHRFQHYLLANNLFSHANHVALLYTWFENHKFEIEMHKGI
jgi:hypothetical protein